MNNEEKAEMLKIARKDMMVEKALSCLYAIAFSANIAALAFTPFGWFSLLNIVCILWMLSGFKRTVKKQILIDAFINDSNKQEEKA